MNDKEFEDMVTHNLEAIRQHSNETRKLAQQKLVYLERLVKTQQARMEQMDQKINLLLTKNFNGEATSE